MVYVCDVPEEPYNKKQTPNKQTDVRQANNPFILVVRVMQSSTQSSREGEGGSVEGCCIAKVKCRICEI